MGELELMHQMMSLAVARVVPVSVNEPFGGIHARQTAQKTLFYLKCQ